MKVGDTTFNSKGNYLIMKIGDSVKYKSHEIAGRVTAVKGKKWVNVAWSNGIITNEHINDLEKI